MTPRLLYLSILSLFVIHLNAQTLGFLPQLPEEEQNAIETISLYPDKERTYILKAAQHPEVLVRMQMIRRITENQFREIIADLSEADQKKAYNLSRYPELIEEIAARGNALTNEDIDKLLSRYPDEIHADAKYINKNYFLKLREIIGLYKDSEQSFQAQLFNYPYDVKETYAELSKLPEIVSILSDNLQLTILLGDTYKKFPEQLMNDLDSLGTVVAEQKAKELNDWKQTLESDPETMNEYEQAAEEFDNDEGYDDDVYNGPIPERYTEVRYVHDDWRAYPYWFGWPSWYGYECWYPYPWWYHRGYYYGPGHTIIIISLPSPVFLNWHFHHDRHFYHYPHFTDHMIRHYYGPRHRGSGNHLVIRKWADKHRTELPANWMNDDKKRVDRIREYGKFKMDYEETVKVSGNKNFTEREFLRSNADRYPTLKPVLHEQPDEPKLSPRPDQIKPREKQMEEEKVTPQKEIARDKKDQEQKRAKREPTDQPPKPVVRPSGKDQQKPAPQAQPKKPERVKPKSEPIKKEPQKSPPKPDKPKKREVAD